jgi:hypothetical protein
MLNNGRAILNVFLNAGALDDLDDAFDARDALFLIRRSRHAARRKR